MFNLTVSMRIPQSTMFNNFAVIINLGVQTIARGVKSIPNVAQIKRNKANEITPTKTITSNDLLIKATIKVGSDAKT